MKKKTANLIMVLIIAAIVVAGVTVAFALRTDTGDGLGSQYRIQKLKDNAVITSGQEDNVCTITIVCDTILDNIGKLNKEKAPFVPKDAVILPQTRVSFAEGDTVFDVLQKVCTAADIQLEYSWTPAYDRASTTCMSLTAALNPAGCIRLTTGFLIMAARPTRWKTATTLSGATLATVWEPTWEAHGWQPRAAVRNDGGQKWALKAVTLR